MLSAACDANANGFPTECPLSYKQIAHEQERDNARFTKEPEKHKKQRFRYSDKSHELITRDGKIVLPKKIRRQAVEWCHVHLLHPSTKRLELMLRQHYTFIGLRSQVERTCKACVVCKSLKKSHLKCGKVPIKQNVKHIPWHSHAVCQFNRCLSFWQEGS